MTLHIHNCVCVCARIYRDVCVWVCVHVCVCTQASVYTIEVGCVCTCKHLYTQLICTYKYTRTCTCMYYMVYEHSSTTYSAENITWTETLSPITKTAGTKVPIPWSAKEIFFLFFIPTLLELIIEQTNKYAAECMGLEKYEKWNKVTVDELCAYMGFMLLIGIVNLP